ncbi:MAG: hypothetical protein HN341_14460 [Verrucomicrobia bacterium]|jgi:hypothetical protein|nr:hypothetical protein [Verrucomicrobiota bacterium]
MAKYTQNPGKETISQRSLKSGAKRQLTVVTLGGTNTGAFNKMVFRSPASKARVLGVKISNHAAMYHAAAEADTWIFNLVNTSTAATLNSVAVSLSGQTLAATSFKTIAVDNGNSTLGAQAGLQLKLTVSGAPQTLSNSSVFIEWTPTSDS